MSIIVAECGINHCGDVGRACEMIPWARSAGADAVKFQLFTGRARPKGKEFILSPGEWKRVMKRGGEEDIDVFFSVFDFESVKLAQELGAKWVKLSFVERRNSRLIERCNKAGFEKKIVSVDLWGQYNRDELKYWDKLYCPNNGWSGYYPTSHEDIEWGKYLLIAGESEMGWSDHCRGFSAAILAAYAGASIIEKHFKISDDCPDSKISIGPEDFALMAHTIRDQSQIGQILRAKRDQTMQENGEVKGGRSDIFYRP